ncbi:hypothetical protein B0H13DRAFT_1909391 [Mycena leptocephala]|nr:hypothetical protein B0H13DRAFT_1909391 [Mycena leptocephala]
MAMNHPKRYTPRDEKIEKREIKRKMRDTENRNKERMNASHSIPPRTNLVPRTDTNSAPRPDTPKSHYGEALSFMIKIPPTPLSRTEGNEQETSHLHWNRLESGNETSNPDWHNSNTKGEREAKGSGGGAGKIKPMQSEFKDPCAVVKPGGRNESWERRTEDTGRKFEGKMESVGTPHTLYASEAPNNPDSVSGDDERQWDCLLGEELPDTECTEFQAGLGDEEDIELATESSLDSFTKFLVDAQIAAQTAERKRERENGRKRIRGMYTGHSKQTK